jgi:hypothetical protein
MHHNEDDYHSNMHYDSRDDMYNNDTYETSSETSSENTYETSSEDTYEYSNYEFISDDMYNIFSDTHYWFEDISEIMNDSYIEEEIYDSLVYYNMFIEPYLCNCEVGLCQLCNGSINNIKYCCNYNIFIKEHPSILHALNKFDSSIIPVEPLVFFHEPTNFEKKDIKYLTTYIKLVQELSNISICNKKLKILLILLISNFTITHFNVLQDEFKKFISVLLQRINELIDNTEDTKLVLSEYNENISIVYHWKEIIESMS